jgi:hypothetical protein
MHTIQPKKDRNKIQGHYQNNRMNPAVLEMMRQSRSNVLNPDKRRSSRNNERVALAKGE